MEAVANAAALMATGWLVIVAAQITHASGSRILLAASIPLALEIALQQRWIYTWLDALVGGKNYLSPLQQGLCLLAIGLLSWMIATVTIRDAANLRRLAYVLGSIIASACVVELATFDWGGWTTSDPFLAKELPSPQAIVYTSINWIAMCAIAFVGGLAAWNDRARKFDSSLNLGLSLVLVGSVLAAVASFVHFSAVVSAVRGGDPAPWHGVLTIVIGYSAALIALGLALPATPAIISDRLLAIRSYLCLRRQLRAQGIVNFSEDLARLASLIASRDSFRLLRTQWVMYEDLIHTTTVVHLTATQRAIMVSVKERTQPREAHWLEHVA